MVRATNYVPQTNRVPALSPRRTTYIPLVARDCVINAVRKPSSCLMVHATSLAMANTSIEMAIH